MSYAFEVAIASHPHPVPGRDDRPVYAAHVSIAGIAVFHTVVRDPGGPNALRDMELDVMRLFTDVLKVALDDDDD
jgi:hypothetical protein